MSAGVRVEILVSEGCPNAQPTLDLADRAAKRMAPEAIIERIDVDSPARAANLGFLGSPSIRVNGMDLEGKTTAQGALCCRIYEDGSGIPPEWLVEAAVLRALRPRGLLFLCVANSARSQMAEGIARSLAPSGVTVWSAGSSPTRVRPEAITVLEEIGIDISQHQSKAVSEIPAAGVDVVITLCAEEECPVFLGRAVRLHWGLLDPAAVGDSMEERLAAFRATRDELRRRIQALFAANDEDDLP